MVIQKNAPAKAKLVDDVREVSRIIMGKLLLGTHPSDLAAITEEAVDVVCPSVEGKQIKIHFAQPDRVAVILPIRAVAVAGPAALAAEPRAPSPVDSPRRETRTPQELRVLVVDDEADARELLAIVLGEAGFVVETAGSVSEAFDVLDHFRPHVLISDIGMPEEDGYSLIRRLRRLESGESAIPSVALTAYTRAEDRCNALSAGFTTHMGKPVDPADLISAVANLAAAR